MNEDIFPDRLLAGRSQIDIPPKIQAAYIAFHKKVDTTGGSTSDAALEKMLASKAATMKQKKEALLMLAHRGTPKAYDILKRFAEKPDAKLAAWGVLALNECRMFLEGELREEGVGIAISGAGGDGKRLRYYVVISSPVRVRWSARAHRFIEKKFTETAEELNSALEHAEFRSNHALLSVLIPPDVAVADVIEEGIGACNSAGKILRFHYFSTNTGKPSASDIAEYLDGLD